MIELELCPMFISQYNRGNLDYLITSGVPKRVLLRVYDLMLVEENLTPIEKLPEEQKKSLATECRATGIKFSNESLREAARILHVIKFIKGK
jgi:hypothetical protein